MRATNGKSNIGRIGFGRQVPTVPIAPIAPIVPTNSQQTSLPNQKNVNVNTRQSRNTVSYAESSKSNTTINRIYCTHTRSNTTQVVGFGRQYVPKPYTNCGKCDKCNNTTKVKNKTKTYPKTDAKTNTKPNLKNNRNVIPNTNTKPSNKPKNPKNPKKLLNKSANRGENTANATSRVTEKEQRQAELLAIQERIREKKMLLKMKQIEETTGKKIKII